MAANPSLEARLHALEEIVDERDDRYKSEFCTVWKVVNERDERYKVQFVTLGQAADLNNKAVAIAMEATDKAGIKFEQAIEKRFESVNEFRDQMGDMQITFARTDLMNSRFTSMENKINERVATLEKSISEIVRYRDEATGRSTGTATTWAVVAGAVTIIIALVGTATIFIGGG